MDEKLGATKGGQSGQKFIPSKWYTNIVQIFRMRYIDALEVPPDALGPNRDGDLRDFNLRMVKKFSSEIFDF